MDEVLKYEHEVHWHFLSCVHVGGGESNSLWVAMVLFYMLELFFYQEVEWIILYGFVCANWNLILHLTEHKKGTQTHFDLKNEHKPSF